MIKNISILVMVAILVTSCNVFKCKKKDDTSKLEGSWELNYISGPRIAFDGLYPDKKPVINFSLVENQISGNNGCNSFMGKFVVEGHKIDFTQPMVTTKMMCMDGQGEQVFMNTLQKINTYSISDDGKTLNFISGDIAMMRFTKK
ncbi:META domain-containing protein [Flavobacterium piscis]|uniref:Heat shock protein HslJ n=1 Tax=Flavobacterium piscis TaxID=1114874 RepID=A0ABU1YAC5_9FLAO|nr:META domain-containing protein [Flavobacterium piscis]MDR7210491.1 heat shock protein HslJ [Flavobacterium piscis]